MGVPRAVQKAIAAFSAERLLSLPYGEMVTFLYNIEAVLIPDAPDDERVTFWITKAECSLDLGDLDLARAHCHRAGDLLYDLQTKSLFDFHRAFGASSLFKIEEALYAEDESPLQEALMRLTEFMNVFMETSSLEDVRSARKVKSPLPVNPVILLREMRGRMKTGDTAFVRKWLKALDVMLTDMIDDAIAKNWHPPAPYGAILTPRS